MMIASFSRHGAMIFRRAGTRSNRLVKIEYLSDRLRCESRLDKLCPRFFLADDGQEYVAKKNQPACAYSLKIFTVLYITSQVEVPKNINTSKSFFATVDILGDFNGDVMCVTP